MIDIQDSIFIYNNEFTNWLKWHLQTVQSTNQKTR